MMYRVRIDDVQQTDLLSFISGISNSYFLIHHIVNENSHYHAYINAPLLMSAQSLRYRVKTKYKLEKTQFAVGLCDETRVFEYIQYCFNRKNGNVPTLVGHNMDDELVKLAEQRATEVQKAFTENKKTKSITLFDISNEVFDLVKHQIVDVDDFKRTEIIVDMALKILIKRLKVHDHFLVSKIVYTCESMYHNKHNSISVMVKRFMLREFR